MSDTKTAVDAILEHYGTKGMKWGVRKPGTGAASTHRTTYRKAPSKLSNEELLRRIARMETEKKYNQLNKQDVSEGKKLVTEILQTSGRNIGKTVVTGGGLAAIKFAVDHKLGADVAREVTKRLK